MGTPTFYTPRSRCVRELATTLDERYPDDQVHPQYESQRVRHRPRADKSSYRRPHISPQQVGHLPDRTHKDDGDVSIWGQATAPGALRGICNGNPIVADAGSNVGAVAERACRTCVESDHSEEVGSAVRCTR